MVEKINVLIVDDHIVLREGLESLFLSHPDFEVVGGAGSVEEAVGQARRLEPDVILMDISLPDGSGVEATREILSFLPQTQVVILTIHESEELLFEAIRSGARGYLLKNTPVSKLIAALRALGKGEVAIHRQMAGLLMDEIVRLGKLAGPDESVLDQLTPREKEVLELLSGGLSNQEIADRLVISINTVKNHVHNVLKKLGLKNRQEAGKFARRHMFPHDRVD
jgi:DNA-binding NarL/FixJ family response regulator